MNPESGPARSRPGDIQCPGRHGPRQARAARGERDQDHPCRA